MPGACSLQAVTFVQRLDRHAWKQVRLTDQMLILDMMLNDCASNHGREQVKLVIASVRSPFLTLLLLSCFFPASFLPRTTAESSKVLLWLAVTCRSLGDRLLKLKMAASR